MGRGKHEGHHGGSWKVAYADFVTSMMALFLVLWLVSADEEIRQAVQDYFSGALKRPGGLGSLKQPPSGPKIHTKQGMSNKELLKLQEFQRSAERLQEQLANNSKDVGDDVVRFEFLADGVRIVALDKSKKPFFEPGTDQLTKFGRWVLDTIAWEIERYPFLVEVEGHTQKGGETQQVAEQGWNLSTKRAMSAQNALEESGVKSEQFWRVAGYADRIPINKEEPESEENRRISIVIRPGSEEDLFNLSNREKKDTFE